MPVRPINPSDDAVPTSITLRPEGGYLVVWSDGNQTVEPDLAALTPAPSLPSNRWNMA